MESMLIAREKVENIISYVYFSKIYHVISCFPGLNQTFGEEYITFPISSSSRAIEWRKNNLNKLDQYVDRIDTSLYKYFRINRKCFKDPNIYKLRCEIRYTCDEIHRKQFKQLRKIFIPLCL